MDSLTELKGTVSGTVVLPGEEGYDQASTVSLTKGEPAVVVQPAGPADVAAAVAFAKAEQLVLSVKSGGHSGSGAGTNNGGLVIDLSSLASVDVLDGGLVRIGGGAVWGDVAKALAPHNLALSSGDTTTVGVGGLALGGGIGWLVRQYGLALDSLVSAEVVTAAGDILTASDTENAELFWAIRGGGGNFGVVTSFTFQAHPLTGVHFGTLTAGLDALGAVIKGWRDAMRSAPEQLNSTLLAMPGFGPEMPAGIQILALYAGDDEAEANAAVEPLRAIEGVTEGTFERVAYADVLEDPMPPPGMKIALNNGFTPDLSDEAIDSLVAAYESMGGSVLMIRSLNGALNRVPVDATAFAHRDSEALVISVGFVPEEAPQELLDAFSTKWQTFAPHTKGMYTNFSEPITSVATTDIYPAATLERLEQLKFVYDPSNLFSQNINIRPVGE